jgi:stage III sporulation protein AH
MREMLIIRRKNIIVGLLVVLLIVTGYLNFVYNQNSTPAANPGKNDPSTDETDQTEPDENKQGAGKDITDGDKTTPGGKITVSDLEEPGKSDEVETTTASASSSAAFFRDYRFERELDRSKEVEYINTVVNNPKSDPEMIKEAQAQLLEITSNMEAELVMENLIKAKGFRDAIVIIHRDNVNVIVDKAELVPEEVAMILDIVKRESGQHTDNIKIIPKI